MKIRLVNQVVLSEELSQYGMNGSWYGAYFPSYHEILIDKQRNIYRIIITFIHEMIHWLIHILGLRSKPWNVDEWFELFAYFTDITKLPMIKRCTIIEYLEIIKKPR